MPSALKCPNPSCPYLFDPTTVPPGVALACPRCGMRFTLGPPAPPPGGGRPAGTYPGGYPPVAPGVASPSAPTFPSAGYAPPRPPGAPPGEPAPAARAPAGFRPPAHGSRLQTPILVAVAAVALAAAVVAVWSKLTHSPGDTPRGNALEYTDANLSVEPPPRPWEQDAEMRVRLGSPYFLVYRRDNPEGHLAFGARDFQDRDPRPSELLAGLTQPLDRLLEPGTLARFEVADTTWLGRPVAGFRFRGQLKTGPPVEGEAYAVSNKGIGYWFLAWAGENAGYDELKGEFADARKRCKTLRGRDDWRARQGTVVPFKGDTTPYTILDGDGIWREEADRAEVKAVDPKADKLLRARLKQKGRDLDDEAELVVYVLDPGDAPGDDPLAAARAYIERAANADVAARGKNTFAPHAAELEGDPTPNAVDGNAPVAVLKSTNDRSAAYTWLYAVSAVRVGDKTVAVAARCRWDVRAAFDTQLVQIARSLRAE